MFFLRQWNRAPLANPEASPRGLLCASNSPSSFLHNSSFHPVISSPSSVLLLGSRSFVIFLHGRHRKQRSLRGKYAKPLYDLPFCLGRGCTTRRQLLCFLYLPKKNILKTDKQNILLINIYLPPFGLPWISGFINNLFTTLLRTSAWLNQD